MNWISHVWRLIASTALLAMLFGCSSTSGLLFRTGSHKILKTTEDMRRAAGNPLPLPRELDKGVLREYRVEPGDVLLVETTDLTSDIRLPGDQTVQADGSIDLGRFGRLLVAGQTVDEIQWAAEGAVSDKTTDVADDEDEGEAESPGTPKVNVRLVEPTSKVYYVTGEVNSPGAFPLIGRETVLDAIIEAGDLTDQANRHKIILSRPTAPPSCRVVLPICYRQIVQLGDTSTNYQIQPGDRIFVTSLTLFEEMAQSLFPGQYQSCPRCASPQIPCPDLLQCCPDCAGHVDAP